LGLIVSLVAHVFLFLETGWGASTLDKIPQKKERLKIQAFFFSILFFKSFKGVAGDFLQKIPRVSPISI
jgi:hypothetical protein